MATDVRATGLYSLSPVILGFFGTGMMVERLKHEGTSHSSSDLLKICVKMGASWSAQVLGRLVTHHLGLVLSFFCSFWRSGARHLLLSAVQVWGRGGMLEVLMVVWRGVQGGCGVFVQTCSRTHSDRLPVVDSPECCGMVSCNWWCLSCLSTLKQNHWNIICSLACQNNSSLPLWSPFTVCIWPVYTRLCPPFCKHLLWPDGAVWVLQWTMVCRCCRLNESW